MMEETMSHTGVDKGITNFLSRGVCYITVKLDVSHKSASGR